MAKMYESDVRLILDGVEWSAHADYVVSGDGVRPTSVRGGLQPSDVGLRGAFAEAREAVMVFPDGRTSRVRMIDAKADPRSLYFAGTAPGEIA